MKDKNLTDRTGCEVIAEFHGSMIVRDYHKSWDSLMPVIAKLNTMYSEDSFFGFDHDIYLSMRNWVADVVIENAFADAVNMIRWYNQQKK